MRLIDADEIEKQAVYGHIFYEDGTENLGFTRIILGSVVKNAEIVEAEPVRHGHWEVAIGYDPKRSFMCSECEKMAFEQSAYCPSCWAKMDEVEK